MQIAFFLLVWISVTQDGSDRAIYFSNRLSKIECNSKGTELQESVKEDDHVVYGRFLCVPVPASQEH